MAVAPTVAGIRWTARGEWASWKTERVEAGTTDQYGRWAGALRAMRLERRDQRLRGVSRSAERAFQRAHRGAEPLT